MSVPRLEIMAMLIGVRITNFIVKKLRIEILEKILWSDSQCVLHWLKSCKPLSVFVVNCIKEIRSEKDIIFRYIASDRNPSDLATWGLLIWFILLYGGMVHLDFV